MTTDEAMVCADIFAVQGRSKGMSKETISVTRYALKQAVLGLPDIVESIEPGDMEKLFIFFETVIVSIALTNIIESLGLDPDAVLLSFKEEFCSRAEIETRALFLVKTF